MRRREGLRGEGLGLPCKQIREYPLHELNGSVRLQFINDFRFCLIAMVLLGV